MTKNKSKAIKQGLYSPEIIDQMLGSSELIPDYARGPLANSLTLLPEEVIDFIVENYVFISRERGESGSQWAFGSIHFKDKKGFILLNSNIWKKKPMETAFVIAHEVAHAFKGHEVGGITAEKGIEQEKEADKLAVSWLSERYKKSGLTKLCNSKIHEKRYKNQKIRGGNDKLTLEEINDKLMKVLSGGIKPPTPKEIKLVDSLKDFFEKEKKEGRCLRWQCPFCGKFVREITSSGQIKDLLISFQKDTFRIQCGNKHRNWFYLKGDNLIFKTVTGPQGAQKQDEKSLDLTRGTPV